MGDTEINDEYRDGRGTHHMRGVVVPSAKKGDREDSGVRFDPHNPQFAQNVVINDENGERSYGVAPEEHEKVVDRLKKGESVSYEQFMGKDRPPVSQSSVELTRPGQSSRADDSQPTTEEVFHLPTAPASPSPPRTVVQSQLEAATDPTTSAQSEVSRQSFEPEPVPEPAPEPALDPDPVPETDSREEDRVIPNEPASPSPKDLDIEPDPSPGPEIISSYAPEEDEQGKNKPLLTPAQTPGGAEPEDDFESDSDERDTDLGEMPENSTHAPESVRRKGKIGVSKANLSAAPMQVARIKVRFISPLGKLAVPYNVVFRYGINLVMIQHSPEGIFYDPPQVIDQPIEVWWHGKVFICFPGVYVEFPDRVTAQTIFFIDEEKTRERRKHLADEANKRRNG